MVGECDGNDVGGEAVGDAVGDVVGLKLVGLKLVGEVVGGTVGEPVREAMWSESATAITLGGRRSVRQSWSVRRSEARSAGRFARPCFPRRRL